jgi:hypothetical protein
MSGGSLPGLGGGKSSGPNPNDAAARSAADKQVARNAVNAAFGIAPSQDYITQRAYSGTTPDTKNHFNIVDGFYGQDSNDYGGQLFKSLTGGNAAVSHQYDGAGYDSALAAYNKDVADAAANKTARQSLYDTVRADAFNAGKTGLDDTKTTAARNNKFALFAQGLNGGSADIDESALLGRTYDQGLLDLGAKADLAESTLKGNDETTRLGLLQSVDNGMNTSDALTSALSQMKSGADTAEAQAKGTNLGDLFAGSGLLYTKSNAARGSQAGANYFASLFPQSAQLSGGRNSGIVTSTGG